MKLLIKDVLLWIEHNLDQSLLLDDVANKAVKTDLNYVQSIIEHNLDQSLLLYSPHHQAVKTDLNYVLLWIEHN
ncbi:hypothetical protein PSX24_23045, partial [Shigella flexneri]|nr:hypothetical protein [Shigella flexneri]